MLPAPSCDWPSFHTRIATCCCSLSLVRGVRAQGRGAVVLPQRGVGAAVHQQLHHVAVACGRQGARAGAGACWEKRKEEKEGRGRGIKREGAAWLWRPPPAA